MASNKLSGNIIGLEINGAFISCETSSEINFDTDMRPASPVDAGGWKSFIPGVKGWTMTFNAIMLIQSAPSNEATILNAFLAGSRIGVRFASKYLDVSTFEVTGYAYVQSGSILAGVNSNANYNATLLGDGALNPNITPTGDVEFGYQLTNPTGDEGSLVPQFTTALIPILAMNFTTASSGNYLYAKIPTGGTPFDEWENNFLNFGSIPDFVWKEPYTIGSFDYYVSRNLIYFTSEEPIITFKK